MVKVKIGVIASSKERLSWQEKKVDLEAENNELFIQYQVLLDSQNIDLLDVLKTKMKAKDLISIFPRGWRMRIPPFILNASAYSCHRQNCV